MLPSYAEHFTTVEINDTFDWMPTAQVLPLWAAETLELFRVALKAPRWITHVARLKSCGVRAQTFCDAASVLGAVSPGKDLSAPSRDAPYACSAAKRMIRCSAQ
jgi:uncharacterized protein YecE (DUF72 family)